MWRMRSEIFLLISEYNGSLPVELSSVHAYKCVTTVMLKCSYNLIFENTPMVLFELLNVYYNEVCLR